MFVVLVAFGTCSIFVYEKFGVNGRKEGRKEKKEKKKSKIKQNLIG